LFALKEAKDVRLGAAGLVFVAATLALMSPSSAGIPASPNCDIWAETDTAMVGDTVAVYVVLRDVYGELIPGLPCVFYTEHPGNDFMIGNPDTTDLNGFAQAAMWTDAHSLAFHDSHIYLDCDGVVVGPSAPMYWVCRAGVEADGGGAASFALYPNRPNPFTATTEIGYSLPVRSPVNLAVYDVLGKMVRSLCSVSTDAGYHVCRWDGTDEAGRPVSSGVYYIRMAVPGYESTRRLTLLR
jgi:hypothetical protein